MINKSKTTQKRKMKIQSSAGSESTRRATAMRRNRSNINNINNRSDINNINNRSDINAP
jgi:hypothetical protein